MEEFVAGTHEGTLNDMVAENLTVEFVHRRGSTRAPLSVREAPSWCVEQVEHSEDREWELNEASVSMNTSRRGRTAFPRLG